MEIKDICQAKFFPSLSGSIQVNGNLIVTDICVPEIFFHERYNLCFCQCWGGKLLL